MFVALPPSDMPPAGRVGCLLTLATALLLLGGGVLAAFLVGPAGGEAWVMPAVGGAFALVGALLLLAGVRGLRGLAVPEPQLFIERGVLAPGQASRVRLRQPGPMKIGSLMLRVCCERIYERQVRSGSSATVEDQELLWAQVLVDVGNERLRAGETLEREAVLTLPADAVPTGPARPDGEIRWQFEVRGEAGWLRATFRAFEFAVAPAGAAAAPSSRTGEPSRRAAPSRRDASRASARAAPRAGLLFVGLGFTLPAAFFLWAFFSGMAAVGRGNPYMALFGGLLFGGIGLVAVLLAVLSLLPSRQRDRHRRG